MAYETDEYGNQYYVPDAQYGGKQGDWDWGSGLSSAASGAGTGASLGALFGPAGIPIGAVAGGLLGGLYGLWTGTGEQDRLRGDEAARIEALRQARKRMEQGFADERSALETQRQLAEQMNPAEALYGTQGRPGLLQAQQAMLAQQMAAQGARNRAALASRGLLGSGMEAATSGALAGQQAGAQAQLQANIAQQYMQQQQARQQQLAQLGLQQAQLTQRQAAARSAQDLGALQQQQQIAQQIAQRNQALLQAGLQGVSTGVSATQQANALELAKTQRKEDQEFLAKLFGGGSAAAAPAAAAAQTSFAEDYGAPKRGAGPYMGQTPFYPTPDGGLPQTMFIPENRTTAQMQQAPFYPTPTGGPNVYRTSNQIQKSPFYPTPTGAPPPFYPTPDGRLPKANKKSASGLSDLVYG